METKKLRITGAQLSFTVGAIQENKSKILNTLEEAEKINSDIVVFPELCVTGYPPEDLLLRESFVGKNFAVLEEIAEMAYYSQQITPDYILTEYSLELYKKHFERKNGINKYYGQ